MNCNTLLILSLLTVAQQTATAADVAPVLPVTARVADTTQSEWSRAWWPWAASFPRNASPVTDTTGARCAAGQQGPVWFLAGTYGTGRTVRTCTVPSGKHLFFPLVNIVQMPSGSGEADCEDVSAAAEAAMEGVSNLVLRVDGVVHTEMEAHRVSSRGCFDAGARSRPRVTMFPTAADGFYVMLAPLPPGRHTLEFGGALPGMVQAVSYTLDVR